MRTPVGDTLNFVLQGVVRQQPLAFYVFWLAMGLVWGSFVTCAAHRLPQRQSLWWPPSHCLQCRHRLQVVDLIPVVSFLSSCGKCRHCGVAVPSRYLFIELASAAVTLLLAGLGGVYWQTVFFVFAGQLLFLCAVVYALHRVVLARLLPFSFILMVILLL